MSYYINPLDHKLNEEGILIVYDRILKNVVKKLKISPKKILEFKDDEIIKNINNHNYVFKIRTNKGKDSTEVTGYFYIIKKENLTNYWLDKISLSKTDVINYINYFGKEDKLLELKNSFNVTCNNILINFNGVHKNLKQFLNISNQEDLPLIFENINTYFYNLLNLKQLFIDENVNHLHYDEYLNLLSNNNGLYIEINQMINELENYDLQFIYYLKGSLYSMISLREKAFDEFQKADSYDNNYGILFGIGQGTSTYSKNLVTQIQEPDIIYYNPADNQSKLETIIISVDERFLRNYGTIILNNILTLRKYQFHIHVVGKSNSIVKSITELDVIYDQMVNFFDKDSIIYRPSFSYEFLDDSIKDINTYSACARFIHANKFIEKFNSDIYIMDADCLVVGDIEPYSQNFKHNDIGIALSRSLSPLMPWKRLLAGDSYFANNELSKRFLKLTSNYILSNLNIEKAWTLDQNALTYAYEKILSESDSVSINNIYKLRRPFLHAPISGLIERN